MATVEPGALTFIRGHPGFAPFAILGEAQNVEYGGLRSLASRLGEGSKLVLCHDTAQVDHPFNDPDSKWLPWSNGSRARACSATSPWRRRRPRRWPPRGYSAFSSGEGGRMADQPGADGRSRGKELLRRAECQLHQLTAPWARKPTGRPH